MKERNSSDVLGLDQSPGHGTLWHQLLADVSEVEGHIVNKAVSRRVNLKRKGVRKRGGCLCDVLQGRQEGGESYDSGDSLEVVYLKIVCTLTVIVYSMTSLVCAFVRHCYRASRELMRTIAGSLVAAHCGGGQSSCKSKFSTKSHSVILSLMFILFVPVIAEGFCPKDCECDDATLSFNCDNASLQDVPILLNPQVQTLLLTQNKIKKLSGSLVFYTELKKLDISQNEIATLGSNNFAALNKLEEFRLSNNLLTTLESSSLIGLISVKVLVFNNNLISSIEDSAFMGLDNLQELDLSKNKLKVLNENSFISLPSLQTLNLSGNRLGSVPSIGLNNLTSLLELDLSDNHVSQVPGQAFSGITKLSRLILDKNNISYVDPGAFAGLSELAQLSLADNRLLHVPSIALSGFADLRCLDMSGNLFETLPQDCFAGLSSLSSLTVSRCPRLSSVSSEAFLSTGELETLALSHNPLLASLSPAAFASLLNLRHVDLTACGLLYLTPTQIPVNQLESLRVSGNPLHCNCSMLWLARLTSEANSSSITIDQPTCASPPTLYGVSLRELGEGGVGCDGALSLWTILICLGVTAVGFLAIAAFLLWRWRRNRRRRKKRETKKRNGGQDKTLGMWSDVWRPENHLTTTHLPHPPPPPPPPNGDAGGHYLRTPPRMPPDHPLHHLTHHHHQGCLQQCPYAALHPVYHPLLLHPDHNNSTSTSLETPPAALYSNYAQTHSNTHSPKLNCRGGGGTATPISVNDTTPNWYETIRGGDEGVGGGVGVLENGREGSRSVTPLDIYNNSPRKVPVTYV
ncbi:insulin-like growth factor-binding protein complex acid labile subunit [Macrobrachium nipponense]|uniref:insulin-like growth factor-binding protein complex acid labile subunit n=1 Tax=Macrobrachium nipponense TaxID=159736 RepID=UPI0030C7FB0E